MNKIAHIGFGAFHRAHQLVYAQQLKIKQAFDWEYVCLSLHSTQDIQVLREQNLRFHVWENTDTSSELIAVDVIGQALHPRLDGMDQTINVLSQSDIKIISLTVTEKAYCMRDGYSVLNTELPELQQDIAEFHSDNAPPQTLIAFLAKVLLKRYRLNAPVSILSCDNIPQNGRVLQLALLQFFQQLSADTDFLNWLVVNVSFPCSMVDRIVPAMSSQSRDALSAELGHQDACGVICEAFKQWVIEDNFIAGRPKWEQVGALLVEDVTPYEIMKLRLLNGAHSFIAYVGLAANQQLAASSEGGKCDTVADVVRAPYMREAVKRLMLDEQAKTLTLPAEVDLESYAESLLMRFSNSKLQHKIAQIAMDGSQKIPQRWCESLTHVQTQPLPLLTLGVAAWLKTIFTRVDEIADPLQNEFKNILDASASIKKAAEVMLKGSAVFPKGLRDDAQFTEQVLHYFDLFDNEHIQDILAETQKI